MFLKLAGGRLEGHLLSKACKGVLDDQRKEISMFMRMVTNSLAAVAIVGTLAVHTATAQQTQRLLPLGSTAHFIYFPTAGYALTSDD
jgi:hypothetical protein